MTIPMVSCIVPVFNGERFVREALDSILAQSYRPLEIIVADDGSSDGTAAAVAEYPDVRYFWQPNAGPAAARNLGLGEARGEFVAFLDSDDLWAPEKLAIQMARFEARPELDLCVAHVQNFWVPELHEERDRFQDDRRSKPIPGYVTQSLLATRSIFERVGPFNAATRHGDAADWFLRAADEGAVMELLPDVLTHRRLHETNLSRARASESREAHLQIIKASLERRRRKSGGAASPYRLPTAAGAREA